MAQKSQSLKDISFRPQAKGRGKAIMNRGTESFVCSAFAMSFRPVFWLGKYVKLLTTFGVDNGYFGKSMP